MKNHKTTIYLFITIFIIAVASSTFAGPTYIFGLVTSLRIPEDPAETGKGWMADAIIHVPETHIISDLDVRVTITHTSAFDLQLYLTSPHGTTICLNSYNFDEYFDGENYTRTIFDDESPIPIEQAAPPFTGRFKPKQGSQLSIFDGQDACGYWKLRIYDAFYADTGTLDNVELMITNPEPTTLLLFIPAGLILKTVTPHRRSFRPSRRRAEKSIK